MYRHTQIATAILVLLAFIASFVSLAVYLIGADSMLLLFGAILLVVGLCFYSMTIEVSDGHIGWSIGPGIAKHRIAFDEIERVDPVTNSLIHGLGIRITHDGWVYAVSGLTAVALTMKDGTVYRLGTNDQQGLIAVLRTYFPEPEVEEVPPEPEEDEEEWD